MSPTSLLPLTLVRIEQLTYTMMFQTSALLHTSGSKFRSDWPNPGFSSKAIMYFPSTRFWSQRSAVEFAKAFHIAVFESLLICINLSRVFSDTAMSPEREFRLSTVSKQINELTNDCLVERCTLAFAQIASIFVLNITSIVSEFSFISLQK